jgi:hypothetical protein
MAFGTRTFAGYYAGKNGPKHCLTTSEFTWINELNAQVVTNVAAIAAVVAGAVPAGSVTDTMLATAVKVGNVASLTTTSKTNVVGAINEVDANADAAQAAVDAVELILGSTALTTTAQTVTAAINELDAANSGMATLTGEETFTNKTLTSPILNTPKIGDGDAGCTITSADQTHASATVTIPNFTDAADEFVLKDTAQTLTLKTLTAPVITSPNFPDDTIVTLGTTTATAATKITMEFDETTTGVGLVAIGTTAVPQVLNTNPGAAVIIDQINILHSAGAGDCGDLYGTYHKVAMSGDGDSGTTLVGDAPRAYVGTTGGTTVASAAYACQPWVKHDGTGAITAMSALSALCDVETGNFTASTVNAGHFHVEGSATVTGQFDGVMIEIYPDVNGMDSGLAIAVDSGAEVDSAIRITGAPTSEVKMSSGAKVFTGSAANSAAAYAAVSTDGATGSLYASTAGALFFQVAHAGAAADWDTIATLGKTQTMVGKTLTAPVMTNPAPSFTIGTHDYSSGTSDWTLSAAELLKQVHKPSNAGGAVNAIIPVDVVRPYFFINDTGEALTVIGVSGTGTAIASSKSAWVVADGTNIVRMTTDA